MSRVDGRVIGLVLLLPVLLFGMFAGLLMTWHHDTQLYGSEGDQAELIGCTESATVNCDIVNTSEWSELGGVPIATLAFAAYLAVFLLTVDALRGRDGARSLIVVAGGIAVLLSIALFWISKVELGFVCAWCLRLYGVNAAILVLGLLGGRPPAPDRDTVVTHGVILLGLVLLSAGGERIYRTSLTGSDGPRVAEAAAERTADPAGPAPELSFTVTTEDGREATFQLDTDDAWAGNPDAKVAVVMFGDFECGYCKRSSAELARLEATYGDRVLFVFKHFPMDPACNPGVKNRKHKNACAAAVASVCARDQGRFWEFHDLAYKNQHQLGGESLSAYAEKAGLDVAAWQACVGSPEALASVKHDAQVGASLDVHGTPRIFINGKLYRAGSSAQVMARAIEVELGASEADAARSVAALHEVRTARGAIPDDVPPTQRIALDGLEFEIDTFEASIRDGAAFVGRHEVPALRVSWYEAKAACEQAGKRMCTEEEWVSVCQNARAIDDNQNGAFGDDMIEGTAYPYGDFHEKGRCWDGRDGDAFRPVYTGEHPDCVTPTGVYDLTGNLEEWVGATPQTAVLLGGAWDTSQDHARCYRRNDAFGAGYASVRTGFRCCSGG